MAMVEEELGTKERKNNSTGSLFPFDPNTVSKNELVKLGLKERTAQTFVKFRSGGFVFKQKEDIQKIYGITPELYKRLEPFVIINKRGYTGTSANSTGSYGNTNTKKLELNNADSASLVELKGVGPGYAKRILKYRELLGGFVDIEQIREVYGMNEDLYKLIVTQCVVNSTFIKKLNINMVDFKTLNKHPYIDYELTKHIFSFKKNTPISQTNLADVIEDEQTLKKIEPYLEY